MNSGRVSFRNIIFFGGAVLMFVPALMAGWFYTGALKEETERILADNLRSRGELSTAMLARRLHAAWYQVNTYARAVNVNAPQEVQRDFNATVQLDERISWIGMTDVQGRIVAASRGMLEGVEVSQQPWFRRGLTGPFAGDVHEAAQLAKLLTGGDEPIRFINFSAPIQGADGAVKGVVGVYIRWDWVRDQLVGMSRKNTEIFLVSRAGAVLFGPPDLEGQSLGIGSAIIAGQGRTVVRAETWPDGRDYMTAVIPALRYRDLPNFGWSIIVRESLDVALGPTRELTRSFWMILGSAGLLSLGLLSLASGWLATPLRRQINYAASLAEGSAKGPPYEETRYQEAAELSAALVRLQSQMRPRAEPPRLVGTADMR